MQSSTLLDAQNPPALSGLHLWFCCRLLQKPLREMAAQKSLLGKRLRGCPLERSKEKRPHVVSRRPFKREIQAMLF